jgi:hypothetical protein
MTVNTGSTTAVPQPACLLVDDKITILPFFFFSYCSLASSLFCVLLFEPFSFLFPPLSPSTPPPPSFFLSFFLCFSLSLRFSSALRELLSPPFFFSYPPSPPFRRSCFLFFVVVAVLLSLSCIPDVALAELPLLYEFSLAFFFGFVLLVNNHCVFPLCDRSFEGKPLPPLSFFFSVQCATVIAYKHRHTQAALSFFFCPQKKKKEYLYFVMPVGVGLCLLSSFISPT